MNLSHRLFLAVVVFSTAHAFAGDEVPIDTAPVKLEPWESRWLEVESGYQWKILNNSPLNYEIVPTQFSIRNKAKWGHKFSDGSNLVFRDRFTLLASYLASGPETGYLGISIGPVLEWHPAHDKWSTYFSAGGGAGITDSSGGETGGLGQDFTLNWYASLGFRYHLQHDCHIFAGLYFIHHSNGGMTDPNPGIDNLGFTIGISKRF